MPHRICAECYVHARDDALLIIQQELISMNEGAVEADAKGDVDRAQWCRAMGTVLARINSGVANLQPPE